MTSYIKFESLSEKDKSKLIENLKPGKSSLSGFMLENDSFEEIYNKDKATLRELNVSCNQIAAVLEYYLKQCGLPNSKEIIVNGYKIEYLQYRGSQECPFNNIGEHYCYASGSKDITLTHLASGKMLKFGALLPHMIKNHYFFESPNVKYRRDPAYLVQFFGLDHILFIDEIQNNLII